MATALIYVEQSGSYGGSVSSAPHSEMLQATASATSAEALIDGLLVAVLFDASGSAVPAATLVVTLIDVAAGGTASVRVRMTVYPGVSVATAESGS